MFPVFLFFSLSSCFFFSPFPLLFLCCSPLSLVSFFFLSFTASITCFHTHPQTTSFISTHTHSTITHSHALNGSTFTSVRQRTQSFRIHTLKPSVLILVNMHTHSQTQGASRHTLFLSLPLFIYEQVMYSLHLSKRHTQHTPLVIHRHLWVH